MSEQTNSVACIVFMKSSANRGRIEFLIPDIEGFRQNIAASDGHSEYRIATVGGGVMVIPKDCVETILAHKSPLSVYTVVQS